MTISIRLNEEDAKLIKSYAELNKTTISEFVRNAIMEKIEDEYDLECYYKAKKEFDENPKTYTLEEVKKELGL
ncbi:MAG TPA: CopG family transcriptional regulator [Clostridiales bacterium]|nr:CopG family transcriptional regulator [Clostridiales bacterium]